MTSLFKLGIVVASVDYREVVVFGGMEAWHGDFGGESGGEALAERFAVAWEHEAERATEDDAVGLERDDERRKAEQDAVGDVVPDVAVGDFGDEAAVFLVDGAGGGDVLPFEFLVIPDVFGVARLEISIAFDEGAIFDDAATDAGGKCQIERAAFAEAGLGEGGEIGVVLDINRDVYEVFLEHGSEIEIAPREIAEPDGLVALDDSRHRDRDSLDARENEIDANLLEQGGVKDVLIGDGGETDGVKDFAIFV